MTERDKYIDLLVKIVDAFGGLDNITSFNNSASQLRYDVKNVSLVSKADFEQLGATSVKIFEAQKHVQVDLPNAEALNALIKINKDLISTMCKSVEVSTVSTSNNATASTQAVSELEILAPASGHIVSLESLNDGVFSNDLVGKGFAIKLDGTSGKIVAPFDGKITMQPASKSQVILSNTSLGVEAVIVFGLNSYKLDGIGMDAKVSLNQEVKSGDELIVLDLNRFKAENIDQEIIFALTTDSKLQNFKNLEHKNIKHSEVIAKLV
ncbi:PTS glucose transporter subunit IIA [Mycoplasma sp. 2248]|uniref:PTS glucose transporter subunit IIA n=1 Tax=Mycoplasma sp. 2248 TaxID=3108528 RepID=UPI002B1DD107|nr:PTS glucose transporter subunit IIA [Mycoplasma sp. 2248]MEA4191328.1 PTS glucose transporter subunit IIA [Mycoplasma sp. 2248]